MCRQVLIGLFLSFMWVFVSGTPASRANPVLEPLHLYTKEKELRLEIALKADKLTLEQKGLVLETREQPRALESFDLSQFSGNYVFRLWQADKEIAAITWQAPVNQIPPKLHLSANQVVGSHLKQLLVSSQPGFLKLEIDGQNVYQIELKQAQTLQIPALSIRPGRHQLQAILQQSSRTLKSSKIQFFHLGVEPLDHSYLVADKYSFSLYWIRKGVLHRIYPVATGRPGLPTQPGFWLIGNKDTMFAASDWGSYRLRIYRENQYRHHWSGYAVHGTNKPNSIGTEASHGCLRMFNHDVTELQAGIEIGTPLLIVEKLPVYIENI